MRRPKVFYGWWIALGACASQAVNSGLFFTGFGAFFLPILNEFGTSRAALSGAVSLSRVQTGILGPFEGWLVDRFGPRRVMYVGVTIMGTGYLLLALVGNLTLFYLVFVFGLAAGASLGFGPPPSAAVANWFRRKRGLAFGIYAAGTGVGALMVPGVAFLIAFFGWRGAAAALAFVVFALGYPLASMMRHRPEQYGMVPDGEPATSTPAQATTRAGSEINMTLRQAVRTTAFWVMGVTFALRAFVAASMGVHLIPALDEKGYSATQASSFLALVGVVSIVGRVSAGWLADRFDSRWLAAIALGFLGLAALTFANAGTLWMLLAFAVVYGASDGALVSNIFTMRAEYFGQQSFATIGGTLSSVTLIGAIVGPLTTGRIFDVTGSYVTAFYVFMTLAWTGALLTFAIRRPRMGCR